MIIVIVDFETTAKDRDTALAILADDGETARSLRGNLGFRAFTNSGDNTHVGILQEWQTLEDFKSYTNSPLFAEVGEKLRPMMVAAPTSRRFDANLIEDVTG